VIRSFADNKARELWETGAVKKGFPSDLQAVALRKLRILDSASVLADLRSPPGNRFEALKGSREGEHSIRINDQFRLCFVWRGNDALDVQITDYH
jgi:proteic killer suppression protein